MHTTCSYTNLSDVCACVRVADLPCCERAKTQSCRDKCRDALQSTMSEDDIIDVLIVACGGPDLMVRPLSPTPTPAPPLLPLVMVYPSLSYHFTSCISSSIILHCETLLSPLTYLSLTFYCAALLKVVNLHVINIWQVIGIFLLSLFIYFIERKANC